MLVMARQRWDSIIGKKELPCVHREWALVDKSRFGDGAMLLET